MYSTKYKSNLFLTAEVKHTRGHMEEQMHNFRIDHAPYQP